MAKRPKVQAIKTQVPQSGQELMSFVHELGVERRFLTQIETETAQAIASIKKDAETRATRHAARAKELETGIEIYCTARRAELTENGKRQSFETGAGRIEWRKRPPSVQVAKGMLADAIAFLKKKRWNDYLRVKTDLDKEAILSAVATKGFDPTKIPGISVGSTGEDFVVTPLALEIAGAAE